jgi:hypothetical protein
MQVIVRASPTTSCVRTATSLSRISQAVAESPYVFVRTQAAEELALKGQPEAFRFLLEAVENNRFYKQELVSWLKDRFPKDLPQSADDKAVIAFLNSCLKR